MNRISKSGEHYVSSVVKVKSLLKNLFFFHSSFRYCFLNLSLPRGSLCSQGNCLFAVQFMQHATSSCLLQAYQDVWLLDHSQSIQVPSPDRLTRTCWHRPFPHFAFFSPSFCCLAMSIGSRSVSQPLNSSFDSLPTRMHCPNPHGNMSCRNNSGPELLAGHGLLA